MNRKYLTNQFIDLTKKIRAKDPLVSISTDYIAGFPTETDDDHIESLNNIKKINFSFMHVFTYSKRKNTPAAKLNDINGKIKNKRTNEAINLSNQMYCEYLKKFINQEVEVLFEKEQNNIYIGKTSQYFEVMYKSEQKLDLNRFYKLKVDKILNNIAILKK